jgi:hypothetical protein
VTQSPTPGPMGVMGSTPPVVSKGTGDPTPVRCTRREELDLGREEAPAPPPLALALAGSVVGEVRWGVRWGGMGPTDMRLPPPPDRSRYVSMADSAAAASSLVRYVVCLRLLVGSDDQPVGGEARAVTESRGRGHRHIRKSWKSLGSVGVGGNGGLR